MKITPVILAGGAGTRLWPISREEQPKQFLPLIGSNSLFQETLLRFRNTEFYRNPFIVGNEIHRFLIHNQLKDLGLEASEIILEPKGKNTAPALTLATLRMFELIEGFSESEDVILVLPSDHYINDESKFENTIKSAVKLAKLDYIVTFGIKPNKPETGYGYIRSGNEIKFRHDVEEHLKSSVNKSSNSFESICFEIEEFVEKPVAEKAKLYLESGNYFWNSGIFMMKPSVWKNAITTFNRTLFDICSKAIIQGSKDGVFYRPDLNTFQDCESVAIDYAVMENLGSCKQKFSMMDKTINGCVFNLEAGWSDVGSWLTLVDIFDVGDDGNFVKGDVYTDSTSNSIVIATDRMVVTVGIDDMLIVETGDAVLVGGKENIQFVKNIVQRLKVENRVEQKYHLEVQRPWGSFSILDQSETYQVKKLLINPKSSISLQFHEHRSEHWVVVKGQVEVVKGESQFVLKENQSTYVMKGEVHRLLNLTDEIVEIIEIQSGSTIDEQDITRIKDDYHR